MAATKITDVLKRIVENIVPPNQLRSMRFNDNSYILMAKEYVKPILDCLIIIFVCEIQDGGHKITKNHIF